MLTPQNGLPTSGFQLPLFWETNSLGVLGVAVSCGDFESTSAENRPFWGRRPGNPGLGRRTLFYDQTAIGLGGLGGPDPLLGPSDWPSPGSHKLGLILKYMKRGQKIH